MTDETDPQDVAASPVVAASWAQLKARHVNTRVSVRIAMAADLVDEVDQLEVELERAKQVDKWSNDMDTAPAIAERIQALEAEIRATEVTFTFEALSRVAHHKLVALHPPTAEQLKLVADEPELTVPWNPDTFPPAMMAASCVAPAELAGNVTEWADIHDNWSTGPVMKLWKACNTANAGVVEAPKSAAASAVLGRSATS